MANWPLVSPLVLTFACQKWALSSCILSSSLFIHALRFAACLWHSPTLATLSIRQEEWALAAVMLNTLLNPARMILLSWSVPCLPLARPLALNWESAIVPSKLWRSLLPSWKAPTTNPIRGPKLSSLLTSGPVCPSLTPWCLLSRFSRGLLYSSVNLILIC